MTRTKDKSPRLSRDEIAEQKREKNRPNQNCAKVLNPKDWNL